MIYTLTLNPCLDVINYGDDKSIVPGGKGINVSIMLTRFHVENIALGFVGGNTGETIESILNIYGVKTDFVHIKGESRTNIKIIDDSIEERNEVGPNISGDELNDLLQKLDSIPINSTLIMSGSIPPGIPNDIYARIMRRVSDKNIKFVVDTRGEALLSAVKEKPLMIKPNLDELLEIFSSDDRSHESIIEKAKYLIDKGALNVIVSLGEEGAILVDNEKNVIKQDAYHGIVKNTVGSGDSLVAGFVMAFDKGKELALKFGVALGSASSFKEWLADPLDVALLLSEE